MTYLILMFTALVIVLLVTLVTPLSVHQFEDHGEDPVMTAILIVAGIATLVPVIGPGIIALLYPFGKRQN